MTDITLSKHKPSALQRLAAAARFYRKGWPGLMYGPEQVKKFPFIWPSFRTGQPVWHLVDFGNYATDGFERNSLIYSAIMYKARSLTIAPLRAYKGVETDSEELPPDAPLAKLCSRPNPFMGWAEFAMLCCVYFNLAGNCYIYVDRTKADANGGVPTALWPMRPDRISIVPKRVNGKAVDVMGYFYTPEGCGLQDSIGYLPSDMMHIKLPNPQDPLDGLGEGLSPIAPMGQSGDVDNAITRFLKLFFDRGAMPSGMMSYDSSLTPEDVARVKERWTEVYGGVDNWTELLVADQGGKYQRLSMGFNEMGFEALDNRNEARILAPFGVPPILIGTKLGLTSATYSNYALARQAFWEDTMVPELGLFEAEFRYFLQSDAGEFVMFDFTEVPGLKQDATATAGISQAAFTAGAITRNEYRLQIGMDRVEDGDVYVMNPMLQMVPVGTTPEMMWLPPGPRPQPPGSGGEDSEGAPAADDEEATEQGKKGTAPKASGRGASDRKYSEDQPRDESGRWTDGGGGSTFSQSAASKDNIVGTRKLGGGICRSKLLEYEGGEKAVWKRMSDAHGQHSGNAEVNAYRMAEVLSGGDPDLVVVPETVFAEDPTGLMGAAQQYIPDAATIQEWRGRRPGNQALSDLQPELRRANPMNKDRMQIAAAMDYVIQVADRHDANWILDGNKEVWAIDNGNAFFEDTDDGVRLETAQSEYGLTWAETSSSRMVDLARGWLEIPRSDFDSMFNDQHPGGELRPPLRPDVLDGMYYRLHEAANDVIKRGVR